MPEGVASTTSRAKVTPSVTAALTAASKMLGSGVIIEHATPIRKIGLLPSALQRNEKISILYVGGLPNLLSRAPLTWLYSRAGRSRCAYQRWYS
jgi:hypothetical protein